MNILLITNDWLPKKGGITTYLTKVSENLNSNLIIYGPNWAEGENLINQKKNLYLIQIKFLKKCRKLLLKSK